MFGKKQPKPSVSMEWAELVYDPKTAGWILTYEDISFSFPGAELTMPEKAKLDVYLGWIAKHRSYIDSQVRKLVEDFTDVEVHAHAARVAMIEIETPNRIAVTIPGDESWGDMGYDLSIEDGDIVNEGFSD